MKVPVVSVIMPVYNTGKYLAAAIASVLGQTFSDFELIILNDGSTDDSETVVKNFTDPRIIYLKNERNLGLIATLNTALSQCKGEFIARMDGDDICHSERLAAQLRFLNAHPEISVCGTFFYSLEKKSRTKKYLPESSYEISAEMFFRCPVAHPSVMIRSAVVKKYNLRYSEDFPYAEDFELWTRLVMNGEKLANVPEFLLDYRVHQGQITQQKYDLKESTRERVVEKYLSSFGMVLSKEEWAEFHWMSNGRSKANVEFLNCCKKYLETISQSAYARIPYQGLNKVLANYWSSVCSNSGLGMDTYSIFNSSFLAQFAGLKMKVKVMFKLMIGHKRHG